MAGGRKQADRALNRAEHRDRKRRKRMPVSGKNVFKLGSLIDKK